MATYSPGEQVRLQWPAKNHANVGQQRGVQLFFGRAAGAGDDFSHITSKAAWLAQYPGLETSFSVCTPNTPGVDGAECLGTFTVPSDLQEGIYSVIWWWEFNAGEFYSSCYDVQVTSGGGSAPPGTGNPNDECLASNLPEGTCSIDSYDAVSSDGLAFVNAPSQIPSAQGSTFTVQIKYAATASQYIVVDILDAQENFYGGGLGSAQQVSAGDGTITYTVTIQTAISTSNQGVYLKVWNVRLTFFRVCCSYSRCCCFSLSLSLSSSSSSSQLTLVFSRSNRYAQVNGVLIPQIRHGITKLHA